MKYNLTNKEEAEKAFSYLTELVGKHALVEVKKISPKRSLPQNAYLHLLLGYFGLHFGYDLEEAKQVYKEVNASTYKYTKKGRTFWKSSASLTKEEMAATIDKFMRKSADAGCPLPPAENAEWLSLAANEIEQAQYYL